MAGGPGPWLPEVGDRSPTLGTVPEMPAPRRWHLPSGTTDGAGVGEWHKKVFWGRITFRFVESSCAP